MGDVLGCGLTEVIAAFVDGVLNLDQCLCIAECVGKYVEKFAAQNSKFAQTLKTSMDNVLGCGLTGVIAAFVDGVLNLDQCLCIADYLGRYVEKLTAQNSKLTLIKPQLVMSWSVVSPRSTQPLLTESSIMISVCV